MYENKNNLNFIVDIPSICSTYSTILDGIFITIYFSCNFFYKSCIAVFFVLLEIISLTKFFSNFWLQCVLAVICAQLRKV